MNYFLDTEFSNLPWEKGSHLLSFALVSEYRREYFVCLSDIDINSTSEFVKENIIPYLPPISERKPVEVICKEVETFIGNDFSPIFWAVFPKRSFLEKLGLSENLVEEYYTKYSDYDFQLFKNLWKNKEYPVNWPNDCKNLTELISDIPKELRPINEKEHDPLSDAKWNLAIWEMSKSD